MIDAINHMKMLPLKKKVSTKTQQRLVIIAAQSILKHGRAIEHVNLCRDDASARQDEVTLRLANRKKIV